MTTGSGRSAPQASRACATENRAERQPHQASGGHSHRFGGHPSCADRIAIRSCDDRTTAALARLIVCSTSRINASKASRWAWSNSAQTCVSSCNVVRCISRTGSSPKGFVDYPRSKDVARNFGARLGGRCPRFTPPVATSASGRAAVRLRGRGYWFKVGTGRDGVIGCLAARREPRGPLPVPGRESRRARRIVNRADRFRRSIVCYAGGR
jgi:hypothetical protein